MMIYLFCVAVVIASAFVGKKITSKYVQRDEFFKELLNFLYQLKNDISFRKLKINESISGYLSVGGKKYKQKIADIFKNTNANNQNLRFLKNNEKCMINNFINDFGKGDAEIEVSNINNFIENIKCISAECESERKKNVALFYKLSLAVGIVICILII